MKLFQSTDPAEWFLLKIFQLGMFCVGWIMLVSVFNFMFNNTIVPVVFATSIIGFISFSYFIYRTVVK